MAYDWAANKDAYKAHRARVMAEHGQWVGLFDKDMNPIMDIEDWESAEWQGVFSDTGSMSMEFLGHLPDGSRNPVVEQLLMAPLADVDNPQEMERLFHEAVWIVVERPGLPRRAYRVTSLTPEGGQDFPRRMSVEGVDTVEFLKHLPLWADPSNRSKIVQLQFADIQDGSAEEVSRKLIGRNLIGYQQQSLLGSMFDWTDDYSSPSKWAGFKPDLHPIICSPVPSGLPSEWCVVEARWDNAWDVLKATWDAAGILLTADLWLPGDQQPFPNHTTLSRPTVVVDFTPRSTVSGAAGLLGQGWRSLQRVIDSDNISSVTSFADASIPSADGRDPWVKFEFENAPSMSIRKSTDHTFLVGGQSPKGLNDVMEVGIKTVVAAGISLIPGIGPPIAEAIKGGGELLAKLAANRFLNLNEFTDKVRKAYHGRYAYTSVAKTGQANSAEALQKAWQAKTETAGGLSIEFDVDSPEPYLPGRDFDLGDTIGVRAWGAIWAAYISELTWTSTEDKPVGWTLKLGNLNALKDMDALLAENAETVRSVIGRISTFVGN